MDSRRVLQHKYTHMCVCVYQAVPGWDLSPPPPLQLCHLLFYLLTEQCLLFCYSHLSPVPEGMICATWVHTDLSQQPLCFSAERNVLVPFIFSIEKWILTITTWGHVYEVMWWYCKSHKSVFFVNLSKLVKMSLVLFTNSSSFLSCALPQKSLMAVSADKCSGHIMWWFL